MKPQDFERGLRAPDAQVRIQTAHIVGTVDEVAVLEAVAAQYRVESDTQVKAALAWAGKRLQAARQAGYSTLNALIQHFQIDTTYRTNSADVGEQAAMRQLQYQMQMDALRAQEKAAAGKVVTRLARGSMFGLPGLMMTPGASLDPEINASALTQPAAPRQRIMPTRPADTDITRLVQRLLHDENQVRRAAAARDLAMLVNNPRALPHLARAFMQDRSPQVQVAAQSAAKLLYWNAIYWHMEQDGSMAAEIIRRGGQAPTPIAIDHPVQPSDSDDSLAAILAASYADTATNTTADAVAAAKYIDQPATKSRPSAKSRNGGATLLVLVGMMIVLICGGVFLIAAEAFRAAQTVTGSAEFTNLVNALAATPEDYSQIPADLDWQGDLLPFETVYGTLYSTGGDAWTFSGLVGDSVSILAAGLDEASPPRLLLYGPDQRLVAERASDAALLVNVPLIAELPADGEYTLVLRAAGEGGDYELTFNHFAASFE